jgi:hypothetical protein
MVFSIIYDFNSKYKNNKEITEYLYNHYILLIIIIDINLFFQANKLYMIFTALTLPVVIALSYYKLYPIYIKNAILFFNNQLKIFLNFNKY